MVFRARDGNTHTGVLIHQYMAFEGGMRYIIRFEGKEYRCVKNESGELVELVV